MDGDRFDWLSRHLAGNAPRRTLLGGLFGTLAFSVTQPVSNARKKRKRRCKPPKVKCGKKCLPAGACCTNAECAAVIGQVCVASVCECPGGQVVAGNRCVTPCVPACDDCRRCETGTCVTVADDTPCTDGGKCKAGVCEPDRSFGCTSTKNACATTNGVACPDSTTTDAKCFVDAVGESVCGVGLCTSVTTDEACESEVGEGAFVLPCPLCIIGSSRVCVQPVKQ